MAHRGFAGNHAASINPNAQASNSSDMAHNNPMKEGTTPSHKGPNTSDDLLEFYFGSPCSTHKNSGLPHRSKW